MQFGCPSISGHVQIGRHHRKRTTRIPDRVDDLIWPNQKIVIANATETAQGRPALPDAAAAGARATMASRTNVMFSIPMLFFMGAASHLPMQVSPTANLSVVAGVVLAIIGLLELNALKGKKLGPLEKVPGVIHMGFLLAIATYVIVEVLTK